MALSVQELLETEAVALSSGGEAMMYVDFLTQPTLSVMVTVYMPAAKLSMEEVVPPVDHMN